VVPTSIVLVASDGSRQTLSAPNSARIVAESVVSSVSDCSGWPTLMITSPPGARWSRTSAKNSRVAR
jgi:hypothetical protein